MLNVGQKEKKCVRFLADEMSEAERFVFEIELSLDNELLAIFENFKTIWISYPINHLPQNTISFDQIIKNNDQPKKFKSPNNVLQKRAILSTAILFILSVVFYVVEFSNSGYTNHRIAGKGQRLTFILPDSSTVVLNSGSEVKYSNDFTKRRTIFLKGEAFFKVTKNNDSPFIVHTNDFDVKVLGTEFNINSNTLDQTVSLAKGKVNVRFEESKDEINLMPNEELVWNAKTKAVTKRNFDVGKILAWKDNILLLDDEKIENALPRINQFYGVNFVIKDPEIATQHITGAFKELTIDEFITSLEFISDLSITKTSENNIEISKYNGK
jgi:ferric-dicitrate binding protein FerR (iron transport regulator)